MSVQTFIPNWFQRFPLWGKALFTLLLWPVLLGYAVYVMWQRDLGDRSGQFALTVLATALVVGLWVMPVLGVMGGSTSDESRSESSAANPAPAVTPAPAETSTSEDSESEPVCPIVYDAATVTNVVDGDTIDVEFEDGTEDRIRLIGIDTPEDTTEKEPYGSEATAYTVECLLGKTVYLETDAELRDKYDRQLAYVWLEIPTTTTSNEILAKQFNARLLFDGYAQLATYPPNVKYVDYFTTYQERARDRLAGLWDLQAEAAEPEPEPEPEPVPAPVVTPEPEPEPAPAPAPSDPTVYVTNTGAKYHTGGCQYLSSSKIAISLSDAISQGYTP